ncbi:MAG: T9SS type A sorting domain-containing protein [Bacteroidota bacterium]
MPKSNTLKAGNINLINVPLTCNAVQPVSISPSGTSYFCPGGSVTLNSNGLTTAYVWPVAGSYNNAGTANGQGDAARFNTLTSVAVSPAGDIYVAENSPYSTIRKITPSGYVTGFGIENQVTATFGDPWGIDFDSKGNLFICEYLGGRIRKIDKNGAATTFATGFTGPHAVKTDANDNLIIAEYGSSAIRKITPAGTISYVAQGLPTAPLDLLVDGSGNIFFTGSNRIWKIPAGSSAATVFSGQETAGNTNGTANAAQFNDPRGITADAFGNAYITEAGNLGIRKINLSTGAVTAVWTPVGTGDNYGPLNTATAVPVLASALDLDGNLILPSLNAHDVRKLILATTPLWTIQSTSITTLATTAAITVNVAATVSLQQVNAIGCKSAAGNPVSITANPQPSTPVISTSGSTTVCQGAGVLLTQISSAGATYIWNDNTTTSRVLSATTSGSYSVRKIVDGCTSAFSNTIVVTVNPVPVASISANNSGVLCSSEGVVLTASGGTTYLWENNSTTNPRSIASAGTYNVRAISNGCTSAVSSSVVVYAKPTKPTISAGTTTFCAGGSVTLTSSAVTGDNYLWSNGETTKAITVSSTGDYTVQTISTGCTSVVSNVKSVIVNPIPAAPVITSPATNICGSGSITLSASTVAGATYIWSNGITTGQTLTASTAGSYSVRSIMSGCTSVASNVIAITVNPVPATPSITAGGTLAFCYGGSVTLTASAVSGATYLWSNGATTQAVTVGTTISMSVQTIVQGCTSAMSNVVSVSVAAKPATPAVSAGGTVAFCSGGSVTLSAAAVQPAVTTLAGSSSSGTTNGTGTAASFSSPYGLAVDASGNTYVADFSNHRIRKISPAGVVSTFAGSSSGFTNGAGTAARFDNPTGIAVDATGNVYVADRDNDCIRKITAAGVVSTFAGGTSGYSDGIGTGARFSSPTGVAVDAAGNVYVADMGNNRIRKINSSGLVSTVAGSATAGTTDATGIAARFSSPWGIAVDASGILYVAETGNDRIRKITAEGVVSTSGYTDGTGTAAQFSDPYGVAFDASGNVYVADAGNNRIRKISPGGEVSTLAGTGTSSFNNGNATAAQFSSPKGVAADLLGFIYVADDNNNRIRIISQPPAVEAYIWSNGANTAVATVSTSGSYTLQTVSGSCTSAASNAVVVTVSPGPATPVISSPSTSICGNGNLTLTCSATTGGATYLWSTGETTRAITVTTAGSYSVQTAFPGCTSALSNVITVSRNLLVPAPSVSAAGTTSFCSGGSVTLTPATVLLATGNYAGSSAGTTNGSVNIAKFDTPYGLTFDASGSMYVADYGNNQIRKITSAGTVSLFAGHTLGSSGYSDVPTIRFNGPSGVAVDASGNVFVADADNNVIRKITSGGSVSTFAGSTSGTAGFTNATGTAAMFSAPNNLEFDAAGNLYVADYGNNVIRKITAAGVVSTFAGTGTIGSADGAGNVAQFSSPRDIAIDGAGNIYVAESGNDRIRKITSAGVVSTFAGSVSGFADGTGTAAKFNNPYGLSVDPAGNVYVADNGNQRIRKITPAGAVTTLAGNGTAGSVDGAGTAATFSSPHDVAADQYGNVYVADADNDQIRLITQPQVIDTYLWSNGAASSTLTATVTGSYTLQIVSAGCTSAAGNAVAVTVNNIPVTPVITSPSTSICGNGNLTLTCSATTGGATYLWSTGETTQAITVTAAGSYSVQTAFPGCTSAQSNVVAVTVNNLAKTPVISAGGTTTFCSGSSVTITPAAEQLATTTYSGSTAGTTNGNISVARFDAPYGLTFDASGNLYVADYGNNQIRKITSAGTVSLLAGSTSGGTGYNDATTTAARFNGPAGVAVDASGNVFVADFNNNAIRKITSAGVVSTFAGSTAATSGYTNANGTSARFDRPYNLAFDAAGNLYVAEYGNEVIRKITPAGVVSTFAGTGTAGSADGAGNVASFSFPRGMAVDAAGNVYVSESGNDRIRKITPAGVVSTFAGSSSGFADGTGTAAMFTNPYGISVDDAGNVYVADNGNQRIRKITPAGVVTTIGGNATAGSADGAGTTATFNSPRGVCADHYGNVYVADGGNDRIRLITQPQVIDTYLWSNGASGSTLAASATGSYTLQTISAGCTSAASNAIAVTVNTPTPPVITSPATNICGSGSITITAGAVSGATYIWSNNTTTGLTLSTGTAGSYSVRSIVSGCTSVPSNVIAITVNPVPATPSVTAGSTTSLCDGSSVVLTASGGTAYLWNDNSTANPRTVTTAGSYSVQAISGGCTSAVSAATAVTVKPAPAAPVISAGGATTFCSGGSVTISPAVASAIVSTFAAGLGTPYGVAFDATGNMYVADAGTNQILKITTAGVSSVLAGSTSGYADGTGSAAKFNNPTGLAVDASGNVYVADYINYCIRKITPAGVVTTFAGSTTSGSNDGNGTSARFSTPYGIAIDASGNLFVSETANKIRKITSAGVVSTFATGGGANTFSTPLGIAVDALGNVYVGDVDSHRIYKITSGGSVSVLSGSGTYGNADGVAGVARFGVTQGIASDPTGNVYVTEDNNVIRKITPGGTASTIAGSTSGYADGTGLAAKFAGPTGIVSDASGNLYISDGNNGRIRKITLPLNIDSYLWSNGATTQNLTVSTADNYTLQTISGGCSSAASNAVAVTVNPVPAATISAAGLTTFCAGDSVLLTASGGSTYLWNDNSTANPRTVSTAGNYTVRAISYGCTSALSAVTAVTLNPLPATPAISPAVAAGFCPGGSVVLTASGGTSYLWNDGSTSNTRTLSTEGDYSVRVISNGCTSAASPVTTVTQNPVPETPAVFAGSSTTFCAGESVVLTAAGGTDYIWNDGLSTDSRTITEGGSFSVRAISSGCTSATSAAITVIVTPLPAVPVISAGSATDFCAGGSVILTATGGSNFIWEDGSVLNPRTITSGGAYSVQTVSNNCTSDVSDVTIVNVNTMPEATVSAEGETTICAGESVVLAASGGDTYLWNDGSTANTRVVSASGDYSVQALINGCASAFSSITKVTVKNLPATPFVSSASSNTFCEGGSVELTATGGGDVYFVWTDGSSSNPLTVTTSGEYSVRAISNGCTSAASAVTTVTVNPIPKAPFVFAAGETTFCTGESVVLTAYGGNTYLWNDNSTANPRTVSTTGDYSVQAITNGCTSAVSDITTVTVNLIPAIPLVTWNGTTMLCTGGGILLTATEGAGYLWNDGSTVNPRYVTDAGIYSVQAVSNGCKSASSPAVTVTVNSIPEAFISAATETTFCSGGNVILTASGGSTYIWSDNSTDNPRTITNEGNYTVQAISNGCTSAASAVTTVTVKPAPAAPVVTSPSTNICGSGSISLSASAVSGATYIWSDNTTTGLTFNATAAGSYSVRSIINGCTSVAGNTIAVTVSPIPSAPVVTSAGTNICGSGSITLTASAISGATYIWSDNATTGLTFTASATGSYTVRSIVAGCTSAASNAIAITVNPAPATPNISAGGPTTFCTGGSVVLTATGGTAYLWSDGSTSNPGTFTTGGSFSVQVISNGCTSEASTVTTVTVNTTPATPTISAGSATTFCTGGSVVLKATGGTAYLWSDGSTSNPRTITTGGSFSVQAISNGCTSEASTVTTVTVNTTPAPPTVSAGSATTFCTGGSVVLTASGGSTYLWNDNSTLNPRTVSAAGDYTVRAISSGCTSAVSAVTTVTVNAAPATPTASAGSATTFCTGGSVILSPVAIAPIVVSSFAGNAGAGSSNGTGAAAGFNSPFGIAFDASGNMYVADASNHLIRKISPAGLVSTLAGSGTAGFAEGTGAAAQFNLPTGLVVDASGNVYVTDHLNNRIRKITPGGTVSTFAGSGTNGFADGTGVSAQFNNPNSIAIDATGTLYVGDKFNNGFRKITTAGVVSTVAINGTGTYHNGMAVDASGNVYFAGTDNARIYKVTPAGGLSLLAGSVNNAGYADGTGAAARFINPTSIAVDASGTLYVADQSSQRICIITPAGVVSTLAGSTQGYSEGTAAQFNYPYGLALDAAGNVFVGDAGNNRIRKIKLWADSYIWSNGAVTKNLTVSASGSYTVQSVSGTCTSAASNVIAVAVSPTASAAGSITGDITPARSSTSTYSVPAISGATGYSWSYSGTDVTISGTTNSVSLTIGANATSGTLTVLGTALCGNGALSGLAITVTGNNNLAISTSRTLSGNYDNISFSGTPVITLTGPVTINSDITVPAGVTIITGCNIISGSGSFTLEAGALLQVCNTEGIATSGNTGAIQTAVRIFSPGADYEFNGTAAQITGSGLPSTVRNLTVNNGAGVSLSSATGVTRILTLASGVFATGDRLTIRSNASGTGMVVNSGGTSSGTTKVQRYITTDMNTGAGYRHYASAVAGQPLSTLSTITGTFTPVLNTAYNTAANPGTVTPYPNVFAFDESRVTSASDLFNNGWKVPTGNMPAGTGYSVNISGSETVQVSGTLNTGNYSLPVANGGYNNSGWMLAGNPYPAPIDWNNVGRTNMQNAVYTAQSTAQYTTSYASYVNGIGNNNGSNVIPSMQAFFVRSNIGGGRLDFTDGARLTSYTNPSFRRNEAASLVRLSLSAAGSQADEATVYFQAGNTEAFDADRDAGKVSGGGLSVYSFGPNQNYSINGLPETLLNAPETRIGLGYTATGTGIHTISLTAGEGDGWFIFDAQDNLLHTMPYSFTSAAALRYNSRLQLVRSNSATGIAKSAIQLSLYPNPTEALVHLAMPGISSLTLYDMAGKAVWSADMRDQSIIDMSAMPTGVYALHCTNAGGTSVHKVVKQ